MAEKVRTYRSGLWNGVRTTDEPIDDGSAALLQDAVNGYLPDPVAGSGFYARPGFTADQTLASGARVQAVFSVVLTDGTFYNFTFVDGVLYRSTTVGGALTNVTPTGVTISTSATAIYVLPVANGFVVNDNVNLPWVASNLSGSPITGTAISQRSPVVLLSRGSTDTRVATAAFNYLLTGTTYAKTAVAAGTALPAGTIPLNTWGVYRVSVNTAGTLTVTAGANNYSTGYASETAALAAIPATPAGQWNVGYFTVQTATGFTFIAGTDALQGGASGHPANATNYYAGAAPPWQAFGQPVLYYGAVFFICKWVDGTPARTTITWSEPNLPGEGYQQDTYDNAWTLTQTSTEPLFVLVPTNDALYYFRELSIGGLFGAPGVNFQGSATHDVVSGVVGSTFPRATAVVLNTVYFLDNVSRPWRFTVGGAPEPIWRQARSFFETAQVTSEPLWMVADSNTGVLLMRVVTCITGGYTLAFDPPSGTYLGRWQVSTDIGVQVAGHHRSSSAPPQVVIADEPTLLDVRLWSLNLPSDNAWEDSLTAQTVSLTPGWTGYDDLMTGRARQARLLQYASGQAVALTATGADNTTSTTTRSAVTGTANSTARVVFPLNLTVSRGVYLSFSPTTLGAQWRVYRVAVDLAGDGAAVVEDR